MEETANTVETKCIEGHDLCAYFPVAYVPYMEYDMYDVGIELKLDEEFTEASSVHVDFHIAYFNPSYTKQQLHLKIALSVISGMVAIIYGCKFICVIAADKLKSLN